MSATSVEDFVQLRAEFDEKVRNPNSSRSPVPWYQGLNGRYFMGWKQLPVEMQKAA